MVVSKVKGTGVALVTPFTSNGEVDFSALEKLVNHVIDGGVNYLVVLGTTGESATLTKSEKISVLNKVKEVAGDRVPIVLGHGGNNTKILIESLKEYDLEGISAVLSVTPSYNKPSQSGLYEHYKAFIESCPLPVILYNVPGRTGVNMLPGTTLKLAEAFPEKVYAIKEASGDLAQMMEIINNAPDGFDVISGDDGITLPLIASGGKGLISVIANAFPHEMSSVVNFSLEDDYTEARKAHYELLNLIGLTFANGNPGGVKAMLNKIGLIENVLRLPLVPVVKETEEKILAAIDDLANS
ncbi:MAG: 4-hydroxy-tetrahydrodipicolinate synthase [Flavobacteriales bacterium]|nr:4-hydroxy-tetrahydrodipicolinate synthase [Flavobacteriales bacterium]MBO72928.1 4-hydroxy-tetrahydrodipicolinate synthase [Flavobacteriales bacterium]|tara:strand:+ start:1374 stop:2267 length:894 start_codon:yes stop_codon:yes gene_type:complete